MLHLCFQVIFLIVFTFSKSGLVCAQECSSNDIPEDDWKWGITAPPLDANHTGIIIEYRMENTISITTDANQKYINARLENNVLVIFTTPAFANYEDQETDDVMQLQIDLLCTSGVSNIVFIQPIALRNNHLPVFTQATYNITVKLPLPKGFDLTYYQEISARDIDLSLNRVTFASPYSGVIEVGTSATIGSDKKTFFATLVLKQQLLTLQEPFNFTIIATDSDIENPGKSVALVHIIPDEEIKYVPIPRFEKVIYRGNIDENGVLSIDDPTIEIDSYSEDLSFELTGDDSDLFILGFPTIFSVNVSLKEPLSQENVTGKTFLTAIVTANNSLVDSGSSVIVIDLPTEQTTTPKPIFEKSLIRGLITSELQLVIEDVVLVESSYAPEIVFTLSGDDSSTFSLTNDLNILSITLNETISEDDLESRDFYSFIIVATHPTGGEGETAVLISVPKKTCEACPECPEPIDCPECPTTPEPTDCPECPTTELPLPVDMSPIFQNQFYSFAIKSNEFGRIGEVLAESPNPDATINYEISTENGYLVTRLTIDTNTGEISTREELNSGYYEADVIAKTTINDEELQGRTTVKITVLAVTMCPGGNVTVLKSLSIEYLKENEIHRNIFSTKIDDCQYVIRSIEPNDKEYVSINSNTNMLESISLDREDLIFNDYEVPQIQIKLKLNCGDVSTAVSQLSQNRQTTTNFTQLQLPRTIDPSISDGRWYTLTNDIDFTSDLTVINIIIEDVNDNDPIFDQLTPTLIGYPEPNVANNVIPSYVAIIRATGKDAGINAKIKYSLIENHYFKINPDNGMISPLSDGLTSNVDSVQLTIYATDNYGDEIGRSALHMLTVKRLEEKHLTIVTIRDVEINSSDDVIGQMNLESSIKMMVLHSAIVPYHQTNSRQSQDGDLSVLKMIVYAFGNNGEPLVTSQVQRVLEAFTASRQLTFTSYEEDNSNIDDFIEDNIMWIIVVCVLGVIILLALATIFLMWWFKIRPYEYKTMIEEAGVSQENLRDDFENFEIVSPTRVDTVKEKRESVNISGSTEMESTDDPGKTAKSLLNLLDSDDLHENAIIEESEKRERRKSQGVTFNELVERIDIETDPIRDSEIDLRR